MNQLWILSVPWIGLGVSGSKNPNQKKYIALKVKFSLKAMFWGGISTNFKTNLVACKGCKNYSKYIDTILKVEVAPRMKKNTNMIFQR